MPDQPNTRPHDGEGKASFTPLPLHIGPGRTWDADATWGHSNAALDRTLAPPSTGAEPDTRWDHAHNRPVLLENLWTNSAFLLGPCFASMSDMLKFPQDNPDFNVALSMSLVLFALMAINCCSPEANGIRSRAPFLPSRYLEASDELAQCA